MNALISGHSIKKAAVDSGFFISNHILPLSNHDLHRVGCANRFHNVAMG
jgi:hypothetical protein